jgi:hypothetical protein
MILLNILKHCRHVATQSKLFHYKQGLNFIDLDYNNVVDIPSTFNHNKEFKFTIMLYIPDPSP